MKNLTNEVIDKYYVVLSNVKNELIGRIKEIVQENIVIYDTSEGVDDKYYELPIFKWVDKYNYQSIYSIVSINKNYEVIGSCWETGEKFTILLDELTTDTLYDLYIKLTKGN